MRTMLLLASTATAAVLCTSCALDTPQTRIQKSPQMYDALPAKEKRLVENGRITEGMSPNAVYLAWGRADREYAGGERGKSTLRWDYTSSEAVYTTNFWGGYGYGPYGYRGSYGGWGGYYGMGPDVIYVPYKSASVLFENGRVTKWERID